MGNIGRVMWVVTLAGLLGATSTAAETAPLLPLPRSITAGTGVLVVTGPFSAAVTGCGTSGVVPGAVDRLHRDVLRQTGLTLLADKPVPLTIRCAATTFAPDREEKYRLTVDTGGVTLAADGPAGVLRGLATLRQLVGLSPGGITLAAQTITDEPRFAWRGVLLDVVRHFVTLETVKRQIDAMEKVKLNVLHLHLSDDQGFRVQSLHSLLATSVIPPWYAFHLSKFVI